MPRIIEFSPSAHILMQCLIASRRKRVQLFALSLFSSFPARLIDKGGAPLRRNILNSPLHEPSQSMKTPGTISAQDSMSFWIYPCYCLRSFTSEY